VVGREKGRRERRGGLPEVVGQRNDPLEADGGGKEKGKKVSPSIGMVPRGAEGFQPPPGERPKKKEEKEKKKKKEKRKSPSQGNRSTVLALSRRFAPAQKGGKPHRVWLRCVGHVPPLLWLKSLSKRRRRKERKKKASIAFPYTVQLSLASTSQSFSQQSPNGEGRGKKGNLTSPVVHQRLQHFHPTVPLSRGRKRGGEKRKRRRGGLCIRSPLKPDIHHIVNPEARTGRREGRGGKKGKDLSATTVLFLASIDLCPDTALGRGRNLAMLQ